MFCTYWKASEYGQEILKSNSADQLTVTWKEPQNYNSNKTLGKQLQQFGIKQLSLSLSLSSNWFQVEKGD